MPHYREHWSERRRRGDRSSWDRLENWPILDKESLRRRPLAFIANDQEPRRMFREQTSGTSGTPLDLWWSEATMRAWYALSEARTRRWYGVSRADRWAILGGQLVAAPSRRRPPFWVWNAALKQLYMSSYHLAPDLTPSYLDALAEYGVTYLLGYSSALYSLAVDCLRLDRRDMRMTVAVTNAEPLFEHQRQTIERAFACPVRETYGMAEIVAAASECQHGRLHLWPEVGVLEIRNGEEAAAPGRAGDFVCTSLLNADMPLIRYRTGDRGAVSPPDAECGCRRTLPLVQAIEGRADDTLLTRDGRRIGRLDPVFKANLPIVEAQIIQEALDRITVRYVPAPGFTAEAGDVMVEGLRARMGESVQVILEPVARIPRTARGKFRSVISRLPSEERDRVGVH